MVTADMLADYFDGLDGFYFSDGQMPDGELDCCVVDGFIDLHEMADHLNKDAAKWWQFWKRA